MNLLSNFPKILPLLFCGLLAWQSAWAATGSARDFSGSSEHFIMPDVAALTNNGGFSVGGWYFMDDATRFRAMQNATATGWEFQFSTGGTDKIAMFIYSQDGTSAYLGRSYNTAITQSAWVHIVATWDGGTSNDDIDIWVDGVEVDDTDNGTGTFVSLSDAGDPIVIGEGGTYDANGRMQAVFYSDEVLTSDDIADLYASGSGAFHDDLDSSLQAKMVFFLDMVETSGDAIDATANGHDGTDTNTVTSAAGKITYTQIDASDFERTNSEYLSITEAASSNLDIVGHNDLYIFAWVNTEIISGSNLYNIATKWLTTGNNRQYLFYYNASGDKVLFNVSSNGTGTTSSAVSTTALTQDTWYFVQAYHDATNDVTAVSVNNETFVTAAETGGIFDGTGDFVIGGQDGGSNTFDGLIQSVGVMSAIPSAANRELIFNRGFGCDHECIVNNSLDTNLVSYWESSESSGTRVDKVTANGNDLTDNNTVTGGTGVVIDTAAAATGNSRQVIMVM